MIVGVPKELKDNESRVALTHLGVKELCRKGHQVLIETNAGHDSGYSDDDYIRAGAVVVSATDVYSRSGLIVKVKEPLPQEYNLIKPGQMIFTYFHFASSEQLTKAMIRSKAICIAYETVEDDGELPLLAPMSEIAGKMAVQVAAQYLCKPSGGRGMLLSGVTGVEPAKIVVIGGGVVGRNAASLAKSMGADVTILQRAGRSLDSLKKSCPGIRIVESTLENILEQLRAADAVIGAIYVTGAKASKLITREMVRQMQPGSVIVDVSIDQGGIAETSRPTTHSNPVYVEEGVVHYCVSNMPGACPRTSTPALTNATLPFVMELADRGMGALKENPALLRGLNIFKGRVTNKHISELFNLEYSDPLEMIS